MSPRALAFGLALAGLQLATGAQVIHRCGNTYSDLPCSLQRVPEIRRPDTPRTVSDPPAPAWADSPLQYDRPYWHHGGRGWRGDRASRHGGHAGAPRR